MTSYDPKKRIVDESGECFFCPETAGSPFEVYTRGARMFPWRLRFSCQDIAFPIEAVGVLFDSYQTWYIESNFRMEAYELNTLFEHHLHRHAELVRITHTNSQEWPG